jgi:hypothetical protein
VPVHVLRASGDETVVRLVRHVVVVAVEAATRDPVGGGERVELGEIRVAHQVRPQAAMRRPARIVDEDGHPAIIFTGDCRDTRACAFAVGRGIR